MEIKQIIIIAMAIFLPDLLFRKMSKFLWKFEIVNNNIIVGKLFSSFTFFKYNINDVSAIKLIGEDGWYPSAFSTWDSKYIIMDNIYIRLISGKNVIIYPSNPREFIKQVILLNPTIITNIST